MKKALFIAFALMLASGCGHSKSKASAPSQVSRWSTTPLPVPPPPPNPAPTASSIAGAKTEAVAAQTNVQQALKIAEATPAAQPVIAPLVNADAHLTAADQNLDDASKFIAELRSDLATSEEAHNKTESTLKGDIETLKKAASVDAADKEKQIAGLNAEIVRLNDAQLNKIQLWLYIIGTVMSIGGLVGLYFSIRTGFLLGHSMGPLVSFGGVVVIGFAKLLPDLAKYAEMGVVVIGVALVIVVAVVGYKALHHVPETN